ncbi:MAG: TRAP transporter small permease [Gammaproteobacteria bacterium]|jgi:TRAP-type C4-dicarboxylate transport system permease small subunit|nr:TRAP transporter small permease [Gammaproteobacteria bacterium]MBU0828450.1 TRAP transporter small permease [Gammaproteobacteria bacterium]MBU0893769.1 TRAP transporter small permease [Gammaproteobacteria bacterium]MBU1817091.1 TRAP transporter small permease [Gammaproteobacteria bacterium]
MPLLNHPPTPPIATPRAPVRWVLALSTRVLHTERLLLTALMTLLVILILLNVVTRYSGMPIYWVDEAAVYTVVWLTFVGASVMTRLRMDFAVSLLTDQFGPRGAKVAKLIATSGVLLFGLAMLVMCWVWMDPVGIARYGFDAKEFAAESFNFLYTERTQTLNWPTWVLQLILPIFSATFSVHALANLLEDLGAADRVKHAGFDVVNADAVN